MKCPKCSAPLQKVRPASGLEVETCSGCSGVFYDAAEIRVHLDFANAQPSSYACPKCGEALEVGTVYDGKLTLERCKGCLGVWLDPGEVQKLRKASGQEEVVGPADQAGVPEPPVFPAAAAAVFGAAAAAAAPAPEPLSSFQEPRSARKEPRGKSRDDADREPEADDGAHARNEDEIRAPVVRHQDRDYQHFQTSRPVTTFVLGEFNWKVKVGDRAVARDFVSPPFLLSQEVSGNDSVWVRGEYLEPEEVWQAFGMEGFPPARRGVAPAQPNPHEPAWDDIKGWFWGLSFAAIALYFFLAGLSASKPVLSRSFDYAAADAEKSRVSDEFSLEGRTSNLEVRVEANVDNRWAYFAMALINSETGEALDFGREVSYYHGVDGGESWSEGSQRDTVYLPQVKAGTYYLRIEPESDAPAMTYTVHLRRDVPRISRLLYALLLLMLPAVWVWLRRYNFEAARWLESDHPWTTESDDDDDE